MIYHGPLDTTTLSAEIYTPFYHFKSACLEFFYFTNRSIILKILRIDKSLKSTVIKDFSESLLKLQWKRVFLVLPNGLYKLEFQAMNTKIHGNSYIAIDDVRIWPCAMFRK